MFGCWAYIVCINLAIALIYSIYSMDEYHHGSIQIYHVIYIYSMDEYST